MKKCICEVHDPISSVFSYLERSIGTRPIGNPYSYAICGSTLLKMSCRHTIYKVSVFGVFTQFAFKHLCF